MTAFEAFIYAVNNITKLEAVRNQIKVGQVKHADLPEEVQKQLGDKEYLSNLKKVQLKAGKQLEEELKEWL